MPAQTALTALLDELWLRYRQRVSYAAKYQVMVEQRGGKVQNDHLAFRTFNCPTGDQPAGVVAIARYFEPLGYVRKDKYIFEDKKLTAWHWQHATNAAMPKIFISQLEVDQLSPATADAICQSVAKAYDRPLSASFFTRPWEAPLRETVQAVNKESQYAAWTLLHGNAVNHFTAYINAQGVKEWPDLEVTANALRVAGIPMKAEIEGDRGTKLRQSSTEAVDEDCEVLEADGSTGKLRWSYAYYELAERGMVTGKDGKTELFQGFLGAQATNLFDMTKR
jgi:hypothetical protein